MKKKKYVLWFDEIDKNDINLAGGKGANLGEMTKMGIPVPPGFVVSVLAYYDSLEHAGIEDKIKNILESTNVENIEELEKNSRSIKELIKNSPVPQVIAGEIMRAYLKLGKWGGLKNPYVAVRSSATAEDLPGASFAGQQETYLNIKGEANVINRVRDCWASLFTPRAIFYRVKNNFDHLKVGIAVPVQKMIQSEVSGVMFTADPVTNDKNIIVVESVWGLGETIVQGQITPDSYQVDRKFHKIIKRTIEEQTWQLLKVREKTIRAKVPRGIQKMQKLNSLQIIELAKIGEAIQKHYFFPQDVEWALEKNRLYIVQTRPITTVKEKQEKNVLEAKKQKLILQGEPASPGRASGKVRIILDPKDVSQVKTGEILVTAMTSPDFVPAMQKVNGIITDKGGQTSHAAIVSRELATPCVVGARIATKVLKNNQLISIDGSTGEVFEGGSKRLAREKTSKKKEKFKKTATRIYINLAEPGLAKNIAKRKIDGVGLLRAEFMIANIGVHPKKLIADGKQEIFIQKMSQGIAKFCKAFFPRPVVYRATDFKTNEYRHLLGGEKYEPEEENPLIGFRGAIRYITSPDVFALELEAIKRVRNKLGYKNLWMMIPFVRTPRELLQVKRIMASCGLSRSPSFKLWLMVEIPSNIIIFEEFAKVGIDGISIGSNDLTMLLLGLDRDNSEVAFEFDERNPAVLWSLKKVIKLAKKHQITSSICGQAPSNYAQLVEKLVSWGITSVSVSPDAIDRTREIIIEAEKKVLKGKK
ncbi:MAG: phosphoenolpyruvate synthase [Candidatus Shapirobacteria bacterium]